MAKRSAPLSSVGPDWPIGSVIYRGDEPNLRVVDFVESDDPEKFHILVVEPT
jgi:hypothetical protein